MLICLHSASKTVQRRRSSSCLLWAASCVPDYYGLRIPVLCLLHNAVQRVQLENGAPPERAHALVQGH